MNAQENTQIVKDAYADFGRGDIPKLLALIAQDVEWVIPGKDTPLAGSYHGREAVARFFETLGREVEMQAFEPRDYIAQDDRVIVLGRTRAKVKTTGRTFDVEWVMAFGMRDGKIAKFRQYYDTAALAEAFAAVARAAR